MSEKLNIILGQRAIEGGKIRMHWQVDEDYLPVKPLSAVNIDNTRQLVPVTEEWLDGDRTKFEAFTIPYYDYIYMKDLNVPDESYIIQPFEHDLVVLELTIDSDVADQAFTIIDPDAEGSQSIITINKDFDGSIITEFEAVAGFSKKNNKPYTPDEVRELDFAIAFKDIWKTDLSKLAEAYTYSTLITRGSLDDAIERGDTQNWGE